MATYVEGLTHGWKGYKDIMGQTWGCWQMEKGLSDTQPLPPTLHLASCKQLHFLHEQVWTFINSLVYVQPPSPCRRCSPYSTVTADGTSRRPPPLDSTPRPPGPSPSRSNLRSPQSGRSTPQRSAPPNLPTSATIPKHTGFGMPTAHQAIKFVVT